MASNETRPPRSSLTAREKEIHNLKRRSEAHDRKGEELRAELDEAVRAYVDEEDGGPTRLGTILGITRGRVYQFRDRGRERNPDAEKRRADRERRARERAAKKAERAAKKQDEAEQLELPLDT